MPAERFYFNKTLRSSSKSGGHKRSVMQQSFEIAHHDALTKRDDTSLIHATLANFL